MSWSSPWASTVASSPCPPAWLGSASRAHGWTTTGCCGSGSRTRRPRRRPRRGRRSTSERARVGSRRRRGIDDEIGSVAEEATKLLGAVADWAREHGSDLGSDVAALADQAAAAAHEVSAHIATDDPECRYCPVCRTVHAVRHGQPRGAGPADRRPPRRSSRPRPGMLAAGAGGGSAESTRGAHRPRRRPRIDADGPTRTSRDARLRHRRRRHQDRRRRRRRGRHGRSRSCASSRRPPTSEAIEDAITSLVTELRSRHEIAAVGVGAAGYVDKARARGDVRAQHRVARRRPQGRARGAHRPAGRGRERRERRGLGRVHLRRRARHRRPAHGRRRHRRRRWRGARRRALPRRVRRRRRDRPHARRPRRASCAAAATAAASSSTPAAAPWSARSAPRPRAGRCSPPHVLDRAGGDPDKITGPLVTEAAQAGDPFADRAARRCSGAGSARASRR